MLWGSLVKSHTYFDDGDTPRGHQGQIIDNPQQGRINRSPFSSQKVGANMAKRANQRLEPKVILIISFNSIILSSIPKFQFPHLQDDDKNCANLQSYDNQISQKLKSLSPQKEAVCYQTLGGLVFRWAHGERVQVLIYFMCSLTANVESLYIVVYFIFIIIRRHVRY